MGDQQYTMGISRDSFHKRRKTGGKLTKWRKKRKFELGRPPSMTKIGETRIHSVRTRGGNKKCRILNVVYNASNNELVRTNTLVKGSIVEVDSAPFRQWYEQHYGIKLGKKKEEGEDTTAVKKSNHVTRKLAARDKSHTLAREMDNQFLKGRLLALVTSRPGQSGRCDGYLIEGSEHKFYETKMSKKKGK